MGGVAGADQDHSVDLILMDCPLPETGRYEVWCEIRQFETFRGRCTSVIALTANPVGPREDGPRCWGGRDEAARASPATSAS